MLIDLRVKHGGKYCRLDTSGEWIEPPEYESRYDRVYEFSEGLARFERSAVKGYLDESGQEVLIVNHEWAVGYFSSDFHSGLASFRVGDCEGYISKDGEYCVKADWEYCTPFGRDLAVVMGGEEEFRYFAVDHNGTVVTRFKRHWMTDELHWNERLMTEVDVEGIATPAIIDGHDEYVFPPCPTYKDLKFCGNDLVATLERKSGLVGLAKMTGEVIMPPAFKSISSFHDGPAAVESPGTGKWGYISTNGEWVLTPRFRQAQPFHGGLAAVLIEKSKQKGWFFINKEGERVGSFTFNSVVHDFKNGYGYFRRGSEVFLVNTKGEELLSFLHED